MYMPTGGIYVTLSEFDWNCSGNAVLANGAWGMNNEGPIFPGAIENGNSVTTLPTWSNYFTNISRRQGN